MLYLLYKREHKKFIITHLYLQEYVYVTTVSMEPIVSQVQIQSRICRQSPPNSVTTDISCATSPQSLAETSPRMALCFVRYEMSRYVFMFVDVSVFPIIHP